MRLEKCRNGAPGETPFDLVGDTATEALGNILASVYVGNPAPLYGLVEHRAGRWIGWLLADL